MDINKRKKYIAGGAAAMAVAVAACGFGAYSNKEVSLEPEQVYLVGNEEEDMVEDAASASDAEESGQETELLTQLSSGVSAERKDVYKDETVYVFTDERGNTNKILVNEVLKNADGRAELTDKTDLKDIVNIKGDETFTISGDTITWQAGGKDIYYQGTSDKRLPVDVKVTYYLDGKEIVPAQLAGQSGNVKIRFDYTNQAAVTKNIDGRDESVKVPFVAVTGMMLDDNFKNVTVTNGKVMSEGNATIVIGYAMPGLMEGLNVKEGDLSEDVSFPDYFEVSADVTDFSLDMTLTLVMNGSEMNMAGDIDMSELDNLVDSLTNAGAQLTDGSGQLAEGVDTLLTKMGDFSSGVSQLQGGLNALAEGSGTLAEGVSTINISAQTISAGVQSLSSGLDTPMSEEQQQTVAQQASDAATAAVSAQFDGGMYASVSAQAAESFSATMQSDATVQMISAGLKNSDLRNKLFDGAVAGMYQAAAAQTPGLTYDMFLGALDEATRGAIYAQVDAALDQTAAQIAGGIAANGATAMGNQVADACRESAVTAAGQAAGQAAVAGAEGAKAQISAQINAVQENGYSLVTGAQALAVGTDTLAAKIPELTEGVTQLVSGFGTLADGTSQLSEGVSQLSNGATALDDGINQFNRDAIQKLANAYKGDVKKLVSRINAVLEASTEYDTFTMLEDGAAGTTKFIIRTEGISAE